MQPTDNQIRVLLLAAIAILFIIYARHIVRIDAPNQEGGTVIRRRRWHFWRESTKNILRWIGGAATLVLVLVLAAGGPQPASSVQAAPAAQNSPVRQDVVETMRDVFGGADSCEQFARPQPYADCRSRVYGPIRVERISGGSNGVFGVRVVFVARASTRDSSGARHEACTRWTGSFQMERQNGDLRVTEPPSFRHASIPCPPR